MVNELTYTLLPLAKLEVNKGQIEGVPKNPRFIRDEKYKQLVESISNTPEMMKARPLIVHQQGEKYVVLAGNMRLRAMRDLKWEECPCAITAEGTDAKKLREYAIKDNVAFGEDDMDLLANEWDLGELQDWGMDIQFPEELVVDEASPIGEKFGGGSLSDRFVVPPFTVLNTRGGYWQSRKKLWRAKIGDLGESRDGDLKKGLALLYQDDYLQYNKTSKQIPFKEYLQQIGAFEREKTATNTNVSLFDPVLAEICCKWFCPDGGKIVDCFAGDTQKGLVFAYCGHPFTGVELRQEQVDVNNGVIEGRQLPIKYICDDGRNVAQHVAPNSQDMLFSCPPYYDLEVYSDMENDASNQGTYEEFLQILDDAFTSALGCLKENRFAVIVVGDVRNKKTGAYYCFCDDVKNIFRRAGLHVINELILVEQVASAAIRAAKQMDSRKVCKTHQNVLVFYKGDPRKVKEHFAPITYTDEDLALFGDVEADEEN